jgi:ATP-dependent helicase/nuclease subunit B
MASPHPRIFTIAAGNDPLAVIARDVMRGFPLDADVPPLPQWTIFLPTRRAVRRLQLEFQKSLDGRGLLLPHIRPIDDIDEDVVQLDSAHDLPPALSSEAQNLLLAELVLDWARDNPQQQMAQDIGTSMLRAFGLAENLGQLIQRMETEEIGFDNLEAAYGLTDLALHRDTILGLLALVREHYPARLAELGVMGRAARRNAVIRLQAQHIASLDFKGPVIAAGSTGSNPATRELLKAVACHRQGAVILPGLDRGLEDADWLALEPTHPQFGLSQLLAALSVARSDVKELGEEGLPRQWLVHEIMRPTTSTEKWKDAVAPSHHKTFTAAMKDIQLIEADNRHVEARVVGLALRQALETPGQTAALVTPDRDLAQRVKAEMLRWNIVIDDTAGEPLTRFGLASLFEALQDAVASGFAAGALMKLTHHPLVTLGRPREDAARQFRQLEYAAFRQQGFDGGLENIIHAVTRADLARKADAIHLHPTVERLSDEDWLALHAIARDLVDALRPLAIQGKQNFVSLLEAVALVLARLAPDADRDAAENVEFSVALSNFDAAAETASECDAHEALTIILSHLRKASHRATRAEVHPRLAIYGLAEARMMMPDVVVLAGLNEGKWPEQPDPGPWLNRTMRKAVEMSQPERAIGLTAHDFVEAFAKGRVILTWSKRDQEKPLLPSRWILRLQMLIEGFGGLYDKGHTPDLLRHARAMGQSQAKLSPHPKPRPRPPVAARPCRYSVTDIVKLNRDPYHIYARKILRLQPLDKLGAETDPRLRGTLFHEAIANWNIAKPQERTLLHLIAEGRDAMKPLEDDPLVKLFWLSRFTRIAVWLEGIEAEWQRDAIKVTAERRADHNFKVEGVDYKLTGYADRIDVLDAKKARIIDYKTSSSATPTTKMVEEGWEPQLTLEAYLLSQGAFKDLGQLDTTELAYVQVTGATLPGEIVSITPEAGIAEVAAKHFAGLKTKLAIMAQVETAFLPRTNLQKVDDVSDYDHLSRYLEWSLLDD